MILWASAAVTALVSPAASQVEPATGEVLQVVQRFFDTMAAKDSAGAASTVLPDGVFFRIAPGGSPVGTTFREYLATIGRSGPALLERMFEPEVRIHGSVATVWTRYDFHRDGAFSHCGVDSFSLIEGHDGWRIGHIAYTVERTGCPPYPLGAVATDRVVFATDFETLTADGRLADLSGRGHHGTIATNELVDGPHGRARRFADVADRVSLPSAPDFDLSGPLTIAAWFRVDSLGLHQHLAACDAKWALWITPDERVRLADTKGGGWSTPPHSVRRGEWAAVVAVFAGTAGDSIGPATGAIYLDGRRADAMPHLRGETATGRWSPGHLYPTDACYLGFQSHQGDQAHRHLPFIGAIDELQIFGRALTEAEIASFSKAPGPSR